MKDYVKGYKEPKVFARVGQKVIVYNDKGEILTLIRSQKSSRAGGIDFPGGSIERGEEPFAGVRREIAEETGLEVTDIRPIHVVSLINKDDDFVVIINYAARAVTTTVELSWEHESYKWRTREELEEIQLEDKLRVFLNHFWASELQTKSKVKNQKQNHK